jgi:L-amino acid ligase C-terminal domain 2
VLTGWSATWLAAPSLCPPRNAYDRVGYLVAVGASTTAVAGTLAEAVDRINIRVEA